MLLVKGQKVKLSELTRAMALEVNVTLKLTGPGPVHYACLGLDDKRMLADKRLVVIEPNPAFPNGSVRQNGLGRGEAVSYLVNLAALPAGVARLAFLAAITGPGAFNQLAYGHLRLSLGGRELARFVVSGHDFTYEKGLILGHLYLHQGEWRLAAEGQGYLSPFEVMFGNFGALEALKDLLPPPPPSRVLVLSDPADGYGEDDNDDDEGDEPPFEDDGWPEEDDDGDEDGPFPAKPRIIH